MSTIHTRAMSALCIVGVVGALTIWSAWPLPVKGLVMSALLVATLGGMGWYVLLMSRLRERVDVWEYQRWLMEVSGQRVPSTPTMHNGVVLYSALTMEEVGETLAAISKALALPYRTPRQAWNAMHSGPNAVRMELGVHLQEASAFLLRNAQTIRDLLPRTEIDFPLPRAFAKELLDGTTRIAAVNAGLCLSAGMPGPEAYEDVAGSNLSKRNPTTGVIDKTPDGKWIKGANFYKPNLDAVLDKWERRA